MHKMAFSVHSYFHYLSTTCLPKLLSSMALGDLKRGHNLGYCPRAVELIKALVQPIENNFIFYFMSPLKTNAGLNNNGNASSSTIVSILQKHKF